MADTTTKSVMSLIATTSSRIRELVIKDGQLIFIQDLGRIAFDFKGQRVFYNQIVELDTEAERRGKDTWHYRKARRRWRTATARGR